jgi:uncharacterized protein (UPF0335 family)
VVWQHLHTKGLDRKSLKKLIKMYHADKTEHLKLDEQDCQIMEEIAKLLITFLNQHK